MSKVSRHVRGERVLITCPGCGRRIFVTSSRPGATGFTIPRHVENTSVVEGVRCTARMIGFPKGTRPA